MGSAMQHSKIRVVLADRDDTRREQIMMALLSAQLFDVIGVALTAEQCEQLKEETVPELIVSTLDLVSIAPGDDLLFPLYVVIGAGEYSSPRVTGRISNDSDTHSTNAVLAAAASAVLTSKAADLSKLIEHYMQFGEAGVSQDTLEVEAQGVRHDLRLRDIEWIEAAGNYVCIHSASGTYDAREPITRLAARLQRSGFLRVHRRIVVNTSAIAARLTEGRTVVALQLSDGTKVPVGPMFQAEVPENCPSVELQERRAWTSR